MRLPATVHDANVAGLEPKPVRRNPLIVPDNTPSVEWIVKRLIELKGNEQAQTDLFESLPIDIQNAVWDTQF